MPSSSRKRLTPSAWEGGKTNHKFPVFATIAHKSVVPESGFNRLHLFFHSPLREGFVPAGALPQALEDDFQTTGS